MCDNSPVFEYCVPGDRLPVGVVTGVRDGVAAAERDGDALCVVAAIGASQ